MKGNLLWQYLIVFAIVLLALARIIWGIIKNRKSPKGGSCCGCSLADTCKDYKDSAKKTNQTGSDIPRDCNR